MDLYNILEVTKDATKDDIRKSYLKLVLKYHPDKCKDPDAEEKIKQIYTAYETLKDDTLRTRYDNMNKTEQNKYYNEIINYIKIKMPKIILLIEELLRNTKLLDNDIKNNLEKYDLYSVYNAIITKLSDTSDTNTTTLDINSTIYVTLEDRYTNKYTKISVDRYTRDSIELLIPNIKNTITFEGEGEQIKDKKGNVNINIIVEDNEEYIQKTNDLYYQQVVDDDFNENNIINYKLPDGTYESISYTTKISLPCWLCIKDKGMPYEENGNIVRGKLYIKLVSKTES